jgi:hypothetical protein
MDSFYTIVLVGSFLVGSFGLATSYINLEHQKGVIQQQLIQLQTVQEKNAHTNATIPITESSSSKTEGVAIHNNRPVIPINIPTRGEQEMTYSPVGTISNGEKILSLYGTKTYNGSSKWNYYTTTDGYQRLQLSIKYKNKECSNEYGCEELFTGDTVFVQEYNSDYTVNMYKTMAHRYIPY